ncbi:MAG: HesA/MoeB/ThiF family protein, partial [Pseudomonadota bacterium]
YIGIPKRDEAALACATMAKRTELPPKLRYARQHALSDWGERGQARLARARVAVIGLGGLGAPVVTYLAGAGVGHLTLNDFDQVDGSNLPRQTLYREQDVGRPKTEAARDYVARHNADVTVALVDRRLGRDELAELAATHDVVVDACDNFGTRFLINEASVASTTPLVSAAAIRSEGQLAVFDPRDERNACYACLYSEDDAAEGDCVGQGVFTPLVGVVGSLAAAAVIRLLLAGDSAPGTRLQCIDLAAQDVRSLRVPRDPGCRVCAKT